MPRSRDSSAGKKRGRTKQNIADQLGHPADPAKRRIAITTHGLSCLDFYIDGRPEASIDLQHDPAETAILNPSVDRGAELKLLGYAALKASTRAALDCGLIG
jgi:hypothetical protein